MSTIYLIMKKQSSPIAITHAYVHAASFSLSLAKAKAIELNKKAMRNYYWVERTKVLGGQS